MAYKRTYKRRPNQYRKKRYDAVLRTRSRNNFKKLIKTVLNEEAELKCFSALFNGLAANAGTMYTTELTDVTQGITQNQRIGTEIIGKNFELTVNLYNKTNNELFIRLALLEEEARGATSTIDSASGIFLDPAGSVTSYSNSLTVTTDGNAPVMWKFDTKGSINVLKERLFILPKNNGGNEGSNKLVKWNVPYDKKIRFASDNVTGALNQSRRVSLVATAWAPVGGTQTTYTYQIDGWGKFNFKDM